MAGRKIAATISMKSGKGICVGRLLGKRLDKENVEFLNNIASNGVKPYCQQWG
jgi:hypothetical protein